MKRSHHGSPCAWLLIPALLLAAAAATAQDDPLPERRAAADLADRVPAEPSPHPALSPAEAELAAIQAAGRAEVAQLVAALASAPDDAARAQLQRRIVETKRQAELNFLDTLARQAGERGDEPTAREARRLATLLREPPAQTGALLRQPEAKPEAPASGGDNAGGGR